MSDATMQGGLAPNQNSHPKMDSKPRIGSAVAAVI